jgi:prolyl 4-hydroxylase
MNDNFQQLVDAATNGDVQAQFRLGMAYAQRQQFSRARRWLHNAADRDHAKAQAELGLMYLYGIDTPIDVPSGVALLQAAAYLDEPEGCYQMALIALGDAELAFDAPLCLQWIATAARGGFALAWRTLGLAWARAGNEGTHIKNSEQCWRQAAALGDAPSAYLFGWQRSQQQADDPLGQAFLARAVAGGVARAATLLLGDPAAIDLPPSDIEPPLPPVEVFTDLSVGTRHERHVSPYVAVVDKVLDAVECEYLIVLGEPHLAHSDVFHPQTGERIRSDVRSSSSMNFYQFREDVWCRVVQRRMQSLVSDAPLANAEYLAMLRYLPGQEYRPHRDYYGTHDHLGPAKPGQRTRTIFCYLNNVEEGGATDFPAVGQRVEPRRGSCVLFHNVKEDGSPEPDSLHAGMPVVRGEKWLATLWVRERRCRQY